MSSVPAAKESWGELYRIMLGPVAAGLIATGLSLEVFDHLTEWKSADETAARLNTHRANTRCLLDGLTALELLEKHEARYRLCPEYGPYLTTDSELYLGRFFLWLQPLMRVMDHMPALVKNGPPVFPPDMLGMENMYHKTGLFTPNCNRAGLAAPAVEAAVEFLRPAGIRRFLDLGGGTGEYAFTLAQALDGAQGVVFDRPGVTERTQARIQEEGLSHRLEVMTGDMSKDPLGTGYDLVWTTMSLNHVKTELDLMLQNIKSALNPGGFLVSFHEGLSQEMTAPDVHALGIVPFIMAGGLGDPLFRKGEIVEAMIKAGFHIDSSRTIETGLGPLELDIGHLEK